MLKRYLKRTTVSLTPSKGRTRYLPSGDSSVTADVCLKDIPEGGSKGTVLLSQGRQDNAFIAFKKYIDSLLDLLLPNEEVADHYGARVT